MVTKIINVPSSVSLIYLHFCNDSTTVQTNASQCQRCLSALWAHAVCLTLDLLVHKPPGQVPCDSLAMNVNITLLQLILCASGDAVHVAFAFLRKGCGGAQVKKKKH